MRRRTFILWFTVLFGCGSGEPYDLVPVSGQVTYEDGTLIAAERITLYFHSLAPPINAKTHPRPSTAEVEPATGKFDLATTAQYGDGIVAGRHRVTLIVRGTENLPVDTIPQHYMSHETTPLEVDAADAPFDFKIARPAKAK